MKRFIASIVFLTALILPGATLVYAQPSGGTTREVVLQDGTRRTVTTLKNPIQYDTFPKFVSAVIKAVNRILMPFIVLAFIWTGFLFVRAQGKEEDLTTAKKSLYWSVAGAFILLAAEGFSNIIATTVKTIAG